MSEDLSRLRPGQADGEGSGWKDRLHSGLSYFGAGVMMVGVVAEVPRAVLGAAGKLTGGNTPPDPLKNDKPTLDALAEELAPSEGVEASATSRDPGNQPIPVKSRVLGRPEDPPVPMSPSEPATS